MVEWIAFRQSPSPSALWLPEQSRVPSLGPGYVVPGPQTVPYGPLRLPMPPAAISLPYTHRLMFLSHHGIGSPALDRLSSVACHPCYPGRKHPLLPFSQRMSTGLPHLTRGSASPSVVTRLPVGSLALRPATSPCGNLRPLIAQTVLPRATQAYGQLLGRDFNPQDKRLLLRTVRSQYLT
jgi:hypothetical protein